MSKTLTDPPKASKVKIKKKPGRENEFRIVVEGINFEEGVEFILRFQFAGCTTNEIQFNYESSKKLTTGTYITPDTDCIASSILAPDCNVIWVHPSSETNHHVPVEWSGDIPEQATETVGLFQRILNFFKKLFGGN